MNAVQQLSPDENAGQKLLFSHQVQLVKCENVPATQHILPVVNK
jgi:hypothetical protein